MSLNYYNSLPAKKVLIWGADESEGLEMAKFVHSRCALLLLVGKDAQAEPPRPAGCCKIGIIQPDQPGFLGCANMFQLHSRVSVVQELLDRWRMPCPQ
ncbi:unnamed protein product [Cladocopium goreaui]|uniref:Uncharacterized protein n=1 Tax=Cladocopium goreaui TaxID=2562237 RepID=A0A9P1GB33_9DINO|nr:unnamed protein product [Cladocopium goreaui]CAI4011703.1 unnamed protein product [Cladocopium goreaui]